MLCVNFNLISYFCVTLHVNVRVSVQVTKTKWCELNFDEKLILENAIEKAKDKFNGRDVATILGAYVRTYIRSYIQIFIFFILRKSKQDARKVIRTQCTNTKYFT